MQALIKRTPQHRLQLLPEALAMLGRRMRLKCLARLPDFDNRVMIRPRVLLQNLEAHHARVLFALGRKLTQQLRRIRREVGRDVDMRDHIHALPTLGRGVLNYRRSRYQYRNQSQRSQSSHSRSIRQLPTPLSLSLGCTINQRLILIIFQRPVDCYLRGDA
jgi:hypothetical protein